MNDHSQLKALDAMIGEGKILETLPLFFSEDCTFTEMGNGACRENREAQLDHLGGFF